MGFPSPAGGANDPGLVVYLHGGGYSGGCAKWARRASGRRTLGLWCSVIAPDYRLAPRSLSGGSYPERAPPPLPPDQPNLVPGRVREGGDDHVRRHFLRAADRLPAVLLDFRQEAVKVLRLDVEGDGRTC